LGLHIEEEEKVFWGHTHNIKSYPFPSFLLSLSLSLSSGGIRKERVPSYLCLNAPKAITLSFFFLTKKKKKKKNLLGEF
jgi:hypothetical protein